VDPGTVVSANDLFVIPHFAYNWQLSSDTTAGISIYGNGGMNTEYKSSDASATLPTDEGGTNPALPIKSLAGTYGDGTAGVNLEQLFFNVSFSKKLDSKSAVGASVIVAAQRFAAQGLSNFGQFSLDRENLTSNKASSSFGAGVKVGYQGELDSGLRVGVSYQSKISMSEFDDYAGLFAEGGDFDIPSTYNIGIAYDVGNSGVVIADIQRINFSDVASLSNPISRLTDGSCSDALNLTLAGGMPTPAAGAGCLGGANGAGFGWDDITIIKVGYQFESGNNTYRVGYSTTDQPVPDSETLFNILAPAVVTDHFTAGMTMPMSGNQEFNISAMYAPTTKVSGANPFDGGATTIEIEMSQFEVQAGWAWKY
jgi:long-chain fatty acid transport protein